MGAAGHTEVVRILVDAGQSIKTNILKHSVADVKSLKQLPSPHKYINVLCIFVLF